MYAQLCGYPATVMSRTGGGGFHLLYKYAGVPIHNSAKKLAPFTDVPGDGGFAVLPPSIHPSGNSYEWLTSPEDNAIAEVPELLLKQLQSLETKKTKIWHGIGANGRPSRIMRVSTGSVRRQSIGTS